MTSCFVGNDMYLYLLLIFHSVYLTHRLSVGLREDLLGWDVHEGDGLAHYARACTDITFRFPFGVQELMGIAARGNFDLTQHSEGSGKSMYFVHIFYVMEVTCHKIDSY